MLDVDDALSRILAEVKPSKPTITALTTSALGQVLADDLRADLDSPPFAKALMDGYAVRSEDFASGSATLTLIEEVPAGKMPMKPVGRGETTRIFTGAAMPEGADAVVKQELVDSKTDTTVTLTDSTCKLGRNVMGRGQEMKAGEVVLPKGTTLTPVGFGVCATIGKTAVPTIPVPMVGIIVTGDELVEANMKPMGGQIRNSNGPMLTALTVRAGALPRYLGIARDTEAILKSVIQEGLTTTQVVVLAGGVSAGKFDLVPQVLESLGVTIHFHQVRMKPGKPFLFGTKGNTLVFGLPGNPVSSFVGFELFVRPALRVLAGRGAAWHPPIRATLAEAFTTTNDRPTYHPAKLHGRREGATVTPLPWFGSADLRGLLSADALLVLPAGEVTKAAGDIVEVVVI
ncbi:MAG: molybdopterin molybdotransferase MoeA [Fimbriiglobus sp.]